MLRVGSFESVEKQDYLGLKFLMHKPDLLCFPSCLYKISLPHDTSSSQSQFSPSWNLPNNLSVPLDWISVWVSVCVRVREQERERERTIYSLRSFCCDCRLSKFMQLENGKRELWILKRQTELMFIIMTQQDTFYIYIHTTLLYYHR